MPCDIHSFCRIWQIKFMLSSCLEGWAERALDTICLRFLSLQTKKQRVRSTSVSPLSEVNSLLLCPKNCSTNVTRFLRCQRKDGCLRRYLKASNMLSISSDDCPHLQNDLLLSALLLCSKMIAEGQRDRNRLIFGKGQLWEMETSKINLLG